MTLYIAKKGSASFFIQPEMILEYEEEGYDIYKSEEVKIKNVKKEFESILESNNVNERRFVYGNQDN